MSESYDLIVIGAGPGGMYQPFVPRNWVKGGSHRKIQCWRHLFKCGLHSI